MERYVKPGRSALLSQDDVFVCVCVCVCLCVCVSVCVCVCVCVKERYPAKYLFFLDVFSPPDCDVFSSWITASITRMTNTVNFIIVLAVCVSVCVCVCVCVCVSVCE